MFFMAVRNFTLHSKSKKYVEYKLNSFYSYADLLDVDLGHHCDNNSVESKFKYLKKGGWIQEFKISQFSWQDHLKVLLKL